MTITLSLRALVWTTLLTLLVPYCSAFRYSKSKDGSVHVSAEQDIYSAEAAKMIKGDDSEEGEVGHDPLVATSKVTTN